MLSSVTPNISLGCFCNCWFFLTPIFYDASAVPVAYQSLYRLNFIVHLVEAYRAILFRGTPPDWLALLMLGVLAVGLLGVGLRIFVSMSYRFAEEL